MNARMLWGMMVLILAAPVPARAAFEFRPVGARAGGMGDTFAGQAEGAEGLFWNPAAAAWQKGVEATTGYERPFGMAALETAIFGVVVPVGRGAVGVRYQGYGFALYREQSLGATYGMALSSRLGVGVTVRELEVTAEGTARHQWMVLDVGLRGRSRGGLNWGVSAWNAGGESVRVLGQGGMAGLAFEAIPGVRLAVDVQKEAGTPTSVSVGLAWKAGDRVVLRAGAGGRPERLSLGIGVSGGGFRVDYAAVYHTILGVSHRISITFGRHFGR